jgi:hypothetical protein
VFHRLARRLASASAFYAFALACSSDSGVPRLRDIASSGGAANPANPSDGESENLRVCPPDDFPALGRAVGTQAAIDEYEGCERIDSDFIIWPFEGVDLRPLRALREVRGTLTIGDRHTLAAHGFSSLEGLEGLRRVQGLTLAGVQVHDLEVLRDLERIDGPSRENPYAFGALTILEAENLVDLRALENVRGIYSLHLHGNRALRSLEGLHFAEDPERRIDLYFSDSPLQDFAAVSSLTALGHLALTQMPHTTLDAFRALRQLYTLTLSGNPDLVDVGALAQLESLLALEVTGNSLLAELPGMPLVSDLERVQLLANPSLVRAPDFPRITRLSELSVAANARLERLEGFAALEQLEDGSITDNASLAAIDFRSLVAVTGTLRVVDNPELDPSSLATTRGRIKMGGNRGDTPALLSPCPWPDDEECDEPPDLNLCAPGTDPICAFD